MQHKKIIEVLDELDKYLIQNLNSNGKISNDQNIYARMYIGDIQKIKKYLNENGIKGVIESRVLQTENALLYATNRAPFQEGNEYFAWVNATQKQQYFAKPTGQELYYDIVTGHKPIVFANYAQEYLPQFSGKEGIIKGIETVQKEYDEFLDLDKDKTQETSLTVKKRKNPVQRFFDKILKRGEYSKKQLNNNNQRQLDNNNNRHNKYCNELSNYANYNNDIHTRKPIEKPEQIIAISDLHGNLEKWNKIKEYMNENPNVKAIILGDAMDRGDYGLEILLQIKELCDKGRAEYLPGNHDIFAYNYVKANEMLSNLTESQKRQNQRLVHVAGRDTAHLEINGGERTMQSLNDFDRVVRNEIRNGNITQTISKTELIDWLGAQPIQKKTTINNTTYALAHAWFDDELYNQDKNFNLDKALILELYGAENDKTLNKFKTTMWYREADLETHYSEVSFPEGCTMVVGHTVQKEGMNVENFKNDGTYKPVIYIDTGKETSALDLSNGKVLKYNEYDRAR